MQRKILILVLWLFLPGQASPLIKQKEKTMDQVIVNQRRFGDYGNRGFINSSGRLQGEIVWPSDSIEMEKISCGTPCNLGILNNAVIVDYGTALQVLDKNTGVQQWKCAKFNNAEFNINEKGIVTVNHTGYCEFLDMKGIIVERTALPAFLDNSRLILFVRHKEDIYCISNYFGSKFVSPDREPAPVNFSFEHMMAKNQRNIWSYVKRGEIVKWVCCTADGLFLYIASERALYSLPVNAERDEQITITPFARIEALSLLHNEELLVIEKNVNGRFLHQINQATGKKNTMEIEENGDIIQPAGSSPDGTIYIAIGTTLICLKNGKEIWRNCFAFALQPVLFSVLSDNSVLCVSGHNIFQLAPDGEQIFEKFVIPNISCRPIIDSNGNVYIGGTGGIICLK